MRLPRILTPRFVASAHCDLPCGVYDPAQARIEAESLKAICEKYDYFKPAHFEKYPQLHQLFNEATKLAGGGGGAKSSTDPATAEKLLSKIDEIAKIFWETKQA
jgi:nickel superoxide dismutase